MIETLDRPAVLPDGHMKAVRKMIRAADNYRSACTVLETYEDEFKRFRSMQSIVRLNNAEIQMNTRWEELEAAIDALRTPAA